MKSLSAKHKLFVEHYLQTNNATESAKAAGYSGTYGYLRKQGSMMLKRPQVRKAIEEAIEARIIDGDEVLRGIKEIATNPAERTADRLRALELLGKNLQLFTEKQKHEHSGGVVIEVEYVNGEGADTASDS